MAPAYTEGSRSVNRLFVMPNNDDRPRSLVDHVIPRSPFMSPILKQATEDTPIGALPPTFESVGFRDWLKIVFASSPCLLEQMRYSLKQHTNQFGFTLIYASLNIDELTRTLQRGERIDQRQLFSFSELCDSKILQRPDLLVTLPSHRECIIFVLDLDLKTGESCCLLMPIRTTDFLEVMLKDKFTGFQPLQVPALIRPTVPNGCQFCNTPFFHGQPHRCSTCGCMYCCSAECLNLFIEQNHHQRFCRQLRFLMTGFHNFIG
jgi:hypothetical protein